MTFNRYQELAMETADYPDIGKNLVYPAMGIAGEGGEYCDKAKKFWRNKGSMSAIDMSTVQATEFAKELGDVLWYIAASARELGYSLEKIAEMNIDKLRDRRARGVIKSEGDNR